MTGSIRVLVVDDRDIVRKGIQVLLATEPGIKVVGEAKDGRQAITEAERLHPDVILMDLVMPKMDGVEAIRQIVACRPETRILVLTNFATDEKVFPALKAGALGCLLKDSESEEMIRAIREVHRGEASLHPAIARKLLQEVSDPPTHSAVASPSSRDKVEPLAAREAEILQLVAHRHNHHEIGEQLAISEAMVRTHMRNILRKLHLAGRTQSALYALTEGTVLLDEEVQNL
jgi:NarL family two-component system response regulator LiaR